MCRFWRYDLYCGRVIFCLSICNLCSVYVLKENKGSEIYHLYTKSSYAEASHVVQTQHHPNMYVTLHTVRARPIYTAKIDHQYDSQKPIKVKIQLLGSLYEILLLLVKNYYPCSRVGGGRVVSDWIIGFKAHFNPAELDLTWLSLPRTDVFWMFIKLKEMLTFKKKCPHGGMAERNLETSSILPLTTLQNSR